LRQRERSGGGSGQAMQSRTMFVGGPAQWAPRYHAGRRTVLDLASWLLDGLVPVDLRRRPFFHADAVGLGRRRRPVAARRLGQAGALRLSGEGHVLFLRSPQAGLEHVQETLGAELLGRARLLVAFRRNARSLAGPVAG